MEAVGTAGDAAAEAMTAGETKGWANAAQPPAYIEAKIGLVAPRLAAIRLCQQISLHRHPMRWSGDALDVGPPPPPRHKPPTLDRQAIWPSAKYKTSSLHLLVVAETVRPAATQLNAACPCRPARFTRRSLNP